MSEKMIDRLRDVRALDFGDPLAELQAAFEELHREIVMGKVLAWAHELTQGSMSEERVLRGLRPRDMVKESASVRFWTLYGRDIAYVTSELREGGLATCRFHRVSREVWEAGIQWKSTDAPGGADAGARGEVSGG
jgi:hypothetical protein